MLAVEGVPWNVHREGRAVMNERVCVVMPTYNEHDNLEPTLSEVFAHNPGVDVLVVDDNSPDGTGALADIAARTIDAPPKLSVDSARNFIANDPAFFDDESESSIGPDKNVSTEDLKVANRLNGCTNGSKMFVLHRAGKMGLGSAYVEGFQWALTHGYDVVCEMDMDGSHRAQDLALVIRSLVQDPDCALVLGSRRVPGGAAEDWPWYRDWISRMGSAYSRFMLRMKVRDMTTGLRAYRAEVLRRLDLEGIDDNGYVFQIDMLRRVAAVYGESAIREVPIIFPERVSGESKMSKAIVWEAMCKVTKWGLERK